MTKVIVAYIPVLHKGYLDFIKNIKPDRVLLLSKEVIDLLPDTDYIKRKDALRALEPDEIKNTLESLNIANEVHVISQEDAKKIDNELDVFLPDEDISRAFAGMFLENLNVKFEPVFLRWHRDNTKENKEVLYDKKVSRSDFDKKIMDSLEKEASKSFDWWRQVAAAIVKDGEVILIGHNEHKPDEQTPNVFGDPRAVSKKGVDFNVTTAEHSELALVAEAAKRGISTKGTSIYVTDFPCPFCARIVAHAGFSKCYFRKGYANLDGEELLKNHGVELIYVEE